MLVTDSLTELEIFFEKQWLNKWDFILDIQNNLFFYVKWRCYDKFTNYLTLLLLPTQGKESNAF